MASAVVAGSTSLRYNSDEGINFNSVISARKRSSSGARGGREHRSNESHEGNCRSSWRGARSYDYEIRKHYEKESSRTPDLFGGSSRDFREEPR